MIAFLGVGSNLGNREENCEQACRALEERGIRILKRSSWYETEGVTRQPGGGVPPYLNGVLEVETDRPPEDLLVRLEEIEKGMGRRTKGDWAPRPIDLDILFYGDQILKTERLTIPHPAAAKREFVLKPLLDIAPDLVHPVLGKTIREVFNAAFH